MNGETHRKRACRAQSAERRRRSGLSMRRAPPAPVVLAVKRVSGRSEAAAGCCVARRLAAGAKRVWLFGRQVRSSKLHWRRNPVTDGERGGGRAGWVEGDEGSDTYCRRTGKPEGMGMGRDLSAWTAQRRGGCVVSQRGFGGSARTGAARDGDDGR